MKTNYVLVDFENVQPDNMALLRDGPFRIKVFLGELQTRISVEMALVLQSFGDAAEYIRIEGHGRNALDFHIAYYLGRLARDEPDAFFHVISKDAGFDPLLKHLKAGKIQCQRSASIDAIPLLKSMQAEAPGDRATLVIDNLKQRKTGKPKTVKTLEGTIKALFQGQLRDAEIQSVIDQLRARQAIRIQDGKVEYPVSTPGST